MAEYSAPLHDIAFLLENVLDFETITKLAPYTEIDIDTVNGVLEEFGRLMEEVWSPTNVVGDTVGSSIEGDQIHTPPGFKEAYKAYADAGWSAVPFPADYDGGGFPWVVGVVMQEMLNSANMALAMAPMLTQGAIDAILHHGSEEQREVYVKRMITAEWAGTMNLTEPDAGSDVGALRTKAVVQPDGTYRITGQKIFITFGEHDFTENIIHLVLARTPDAPAGTKGISLFIVPKFLVNDDGSLGKRNDVHVVSIEHKMGIKASPTCVMSYGDNGAGAVGYLIGEPNAGMRYMFTMMNNARLGVGVEGIGLAERSFQRALEYATERKQGRAPSAEKGEKSFIVEHPDVRRMLLTMKAYTEAMRAMAYVQAEHIDVARHGADETVRTEADEIVELLTPLVKSFCTDIAETVTSIGIQVFGGMGFIEETGVAQYYRDAKITQIYEGTNGIQAMDFVGRKVPMRMGGVVNDQLARMRATVEELAGGGDRLAPIHRELTAALDTLDQATKWIFENGLTDPMQALSAATPYQRMFATTIAGWMMARSAIAATRLLATGSGDTDFLDAKVVTARFFAEHLLPQVHGLLPPITGRQGRHPRADRRPTPLDLNGFELTLPNPTHRERLGSSADPPLFRQSVSSPCSGFDGVGASTSAPPWVAVPCNGSRLDRDAASGVRRRRRARLVWWFSRRLGSCLAVQPKAGAAEGCHGTWRVGVVHVVEVAGASERADQAVVRVVRVQVLDRAAGRELEQLVHVPGDRVQPHAGQLVGHPEQLGVLLGEPPRHP